MPDDSNLPPMTSDLPPNPKAPMPLPPGSPMDAPQKLSLMPDQIAALGLDVIKPGSTYTIQLKAAGDDGSGGIDAGQSFDVVSAQPDVAPDGDGMSGGDIDVPGDDVELHGPDDPTEPPGGMPIGDRTPNGAGDSPDEKILGFKRKVKPVREGLPATKNMRNF